jgi:hypoxanthine-DNA glycosylase
MFARWSAITRAEVSASRKSAFPPVVAAHTRVLILGSLPGEASLAAARYYAHPQNQFWRLVGAAIKREGLPALEYDARLAVLLEAGVGLWDTVASAVRPGSLDAAIREAEHAPLAELIATLPALRAIAFNGATAARIGHRLLPKTALAMVDLPSSSPAYAAMPLAEKRRRWLVLRDFLGKNPPPGP